MANFEVTPLDASFGAKIEGIDLKGIDTRTFEELYDCWLKYALLIFPDQHLSNDDQVTFAKRFGSLEFDLAPISNVISHSTHNANGTRRIASSASNPLQEGNSAARSPTLYF